MQQKWASECNNKNKHNHHHNSNSNKHSKTKKLVNKQATEAGKGRENEQKN